MKHKKRILHFLQQNPLATLVTITEDNRPHTTVVYTHIGLDFTVYVLTKESTRKCRNILSRPQVALTFSNEKTLQTCSIHGEGHLAATGEDVMFAVAQLKEIITERQGERAVPPVEQYSAGNYTVIKMTPSDIEFWDYGKSAFEEVNPERLVFKV